MNARRPAVHRIAEFELECGVPLRDVRQAYRVDGTLNAARDNLVVVFHALTGDADAAGGWWSGVVGPGRALDTDRFAVLCTNLLGGCYGTTAEPFASGAPIPPITTRDQARLVRRLVDELGVGSVALAVGGSLGGMVALEWVASYPGLTRVAVVLAAPAAHPAAAIGWNAIQRRLVETAGESGLELARMVAMMTYRTPTEMAHRFGRRRQHGAWAVERYLAHHGAKLRQRFDPRSYLALLDAMDTHDVGRGRGGVGPALRGSGTRIVGVGVPGDRLYGDDEVRAWVDEAGGEYAQLQSACGHDAFLLETEQVSAILRRALAARRTPSSPTVGAA